MEEWLITGASGFIGVHVVEALAKEYCPDDPNKPYRSPFVSGQFFTPEGKPLFSLSSSPFSSSSSSSSPITSLSPTETTETTTTRIWERKEAVIHCLVRKTSVTLPLIRAGSKIPRDRFKICYSDLSNVETLRSAIPRTITHALHIAAQGGDWGPEEDYVEANERGTANLIQVLQEQCPDFQRFVHVSTVDVYPHDVAPAHCEEDRVAPIVQSRYFYSRTKAAAERLVAAAAFKEWTILRPAVVYGPGSYSWGLTEGRILQARRGLLVAGAQSISGIVYGADVAQAVIMAARAPAANVHRQAFNLADPAGSGTWRHFYDALADGLNVPRVRHSIPVWLACFLAWLMEFIYRLFGWYDDRPFFTFFLLRLLTYHQNWPIHKAEKLLGWRPTTPFKVGIERTIPWVYQELGLYPD